MDADLKARRNAIRHLLQSQRVGTQEELGEHLTKKGFDVTQATLSRDLAQLRARRVTLPEGGSIYELGDAKAPASSDGVAAVVHLVIGVDHNDSMVVVHTLPGAASAVARALDEARLSSVLATLAGDDVIFIPPARKVSSASLAKQLQSLWRRKES